MPALTRGERRHGLNRQARRGGKESLDAKAKPGSAWPGEGATCGGTDAQWREAAL
jgi:hypothetical protein